VKTVLLREAISCQNVCWC